MVFDTGTPPTRLATGGIIWSEQQIGLRFSPWSVGGHPGDAWVLESFLLALETERLVAGEANLTLRLCPSLPESGLPSEECLEESFLLEAAQRVEAEWQPRKSFTVSQGTSYWLVMQVLLFLMTQSFALPPWSR